MNQVNQWKNGLAVSGKIGVPFIFSGGIIWLGITIIFLLPLDLYTKNILMLSITGFMFPLSILVSRVFKSEWKNKNNPFASLGFIFNIAQLMYFPIVFWAIANSPSFVITSFAVITGAHFFPYGWLYNSKSYYFVAPIIAISTTLIGVFVQVEQLWLVPLAMVVFLFSLALLLFLEHQQRMKNHHNTKVLTT